MAQNTTPFSFVYDAFLISIVDEMYLEISREETESMLEELLIRALLSFEFPKVNLSYERRHLEDIEEYCGIDSDNVIVPAYIYQDGYFYNELTQEEIIIITKYMTVEWLGQQINNVELTRQIYTGSDFKMTSQANHLAKLMQLKQKNEQEGFHLQRLYKRRERDNKGIERSTFYKIMEG